MPFPTLPAFGASCARFRPILLLAAAAGCAGESDPTGPADLARASRATNLAATTTVVMSNLNAPRGLAWGPEGALYVVETGTSAVTGPCATVYRGTNCYSGTGSVSRLWRGQQERVVEGLPSTYNAATFDIGGAQHISFQGRGNMQVTVGWGGAPSARAQLGVMIQHLLHELI